MKVQQKIDHYFLLFFLVSQQLIAIACAINYFQSQQILLVIFFITVSSAILLALAFYCVFSYYRTAQWILLLTLIAGCFFLIVTSSDQVTSIWCIASAPVIGILLGHIRGTIILATIFTSAFIYLLADYSPTIKIKYDGILILRFLFSTALLSMFSIVINKYRINDLAQHSSVSSDKKILNRQDILTALLHRQCMEERLKLSYRKYESGLGNFCVILADLDNCKAINDHFGRETGDMALKKLGHLLRKELREEDMAGRWSGNQFIVVLPNVSQTVALPIAKRILFKANQIELLSKGDRVKITLSIGVCSSGNCTGLDDLLSLVENCVYQAKQMGRNMVIAA
ncbi:MAG: GGDEF domain-containing protein [Porticoccaceae bacterium]|nr:GGDEF domain-containing protein [Porticoccaceae bacterium]